MNYATWKLNFKTKKYGTGPETKIAGLGFAAEGAWSDGPVESGATILGYVNGEIEEPELELWDFAYVTQQEALSFCQAVNPEAYLLPDGKITAPLEDSIS
jgi:hypothetical protein